MSEKNRNCKPKKWTLNELKLLIDAVKEERCLYAWDSPLYYNKKSRQEALERVCLKVQRLRKTTSKEECQNKFQNLRKHFSSERMKVIKSVENGTGNKDVYNPTLWYYPLLLFLDSYFNSRKTKLSLLQIQSPTSQRFSNLMCESESDIMMTNESDDSSTLPTAIFKEETTLSVESVSPALSISNSEDDNSELTRPDPLGPSWSSPSASGVLKQPKSKKRHQPDSTEDFSGDTNNLTESLRHPVVMNYTRGVSSEDASVNTFLTFIGTMLQGFQDEQLKLDVMNNITQAVLKAKSEDLQRDKK